MSTATLTHRSSDTLTVEIDGTEVDIDATGLAPVDTDYVFVGPLQDDGSHLVTWLILDGDRSDDSPMDYEGVTWDSFRRGDPDRFDGDFEAVQAYLRENEGRAFLVECYQHGNVAYALRDSDEANRFPDRMWDVGMAGIITMDGDWTNPREAAAGIMESYTDWCNGDIYGIATRSVAADGTVTEVDLGECWGFLGFDYAEGEAKRQAGIES